MGQVPVSCAEIDGFILNRLQGALLSEAMRLVGEGYVSPEDLDKTMRDGLGCAGRSWARSRLSSSMPRGRRRLLRAVRRSSPARRSARGSGLGCETWAVAAALGTRRRRTRRALLARPPADGAARHKRAQRSQNEGANMSANRKVIVTCAVTGSIHTPSMSPHLPITPREIADAAVGAAEAGAAIVHLHARDPVDGHPTQDPKYFREFAADIARRSDVVINFTTGGAATMTIEERLQPALQLKPEVASLNMGSMNFGLYPMLKRFRLSNSTGSARTSRGRRSGSSRTRSRTSSTS